MAAPTAPKKPAPNKPSASEENGAANKDKSSRPSRPLPTDRIAFQRQLAILRAFAIASGESRRSVRNADVAAVSNFAETTLSQANAFFVDNGLLLRTGEGFQPVDEVYAFAHAFKWNEETAAQKLAPVFEISWFGEILLPRLEFRDITVQDAVASLSEEVTAGPQYRQQLETILEYLESVGLVTITDGVVRLVHRDSSNRVQPETPPAREPSSRVEAPKSADRPAPTAATPTRPSNALGFTIDVQVTMQELNTWSADRISAFFSGVAKVLAAKNGELEKPDQD